MTRIPREIEIKIDLGNESNYEALISRLRPGSRPVIQENHFFDTSDWCLARAGWALRLRLESGRAILTAKGKDQPAPEGLAIRTDIEIPIDPVPAQNYIRNGLTVEELPPAIRNAISLPEPIRRLERRFFFRNYRLRLEPREVFPRMRLEIDRTEFSDNTVNWELEVELIAAEDYPRSLAVLERLFGEAGIPLVFQEKSKFVRARARLKNESEGNFEG